jgi:DNA polymerase-3 subunit delta'
MLVEKNDLTDQEAATATSLANGNYITARKFSEANDIEKYNFENFRAWMRLCYQNDITNINPLITELSRRSRDELKSFFSYALKITRYCMLYSSDNKELVKAAGEEIEFIKNFSTYQSYKNAPAFTKMFNEAYKHVERNANASIVLTDISLKAIALISNKLQKDFQINS